MTLQKMNETEYTALSTDVVNNKVAGLSNQGARLYLYDTNSWKIVLLDGTLADYFLPITAGDISIGTVNQGTGGSSAWKVTQSNANAANTARSTATVVVPVQVLDAAGNVIGAVATDGGPGMTYIQTGFSSADASSTPVDLTTSPSAGLKAKAMDIIISVATACTVNIITESGSAIFSMYMGANSTVQVTPRGCIKGATAAKKLQATTSVTSAISGLCNWYTEA